MQVEQPPVRDPTEVVADALAQLDAAAHLGAVVDRNDADAFDRANHHRPTKTSTFTITVKDWIDVEGFTCEGENAHPTGRRPQLDATVVRRMRRAGAVVIAKTQPGVDHPVHGACLHPVDATRSPGGSSTGEAALLGARATTLGLGSDSGGSIRVPAAYCGVFGLKPSFGLVPATGHFPVVGQRGDGRTVIGPMATTATALTTALQVIAGPDGRDPSTAPVPLGDIADVSMRRLRVALVESDSSYPVRSTISDAVSRAGSALAEAGAHISKRTVSLDLARAMAITQGYWSRESRSGEAAQHQLDEWDRYDADIAGSTTDFDVLITPVAADVAPPVRLPTADDYAYTLPWSLVGWPAASVPFGSDPCSGLPLAVQVIAPRWHDHVVLAVTAWLEAAGFTTTSSGS